VEEIWNNFPNLKEKEMTNITNYNYFWTLQQHVDKGYLNFETGRKYLYRLSVLLENYAVKNSTPLLATFETEKRYKYVEERYQEILEKIPKAWIIGDFKNAFLAPNPPPSAEVISCDGTNIANMWIVLVKGPIGPFGLVAESLGEDLYRGFFSNGTTVMNKVVERISDALKIKIDFSKKY